MEKWEKIFWLGLSLVIGGSVFVCVCVIFKMKETNWGWTIFVLGFVMAFSALVLNGLDKAKKARL